MSRTIYVRPQIELTPFRPEDKPFLIQYLNDSVVYSNTLTIPSPYTEQDADSWLANVTQRREENNIDSNWVIRHHTDGLLGSIGHIVKSGIESHITEIGYWLAAPYRNQGIMQSAVLAYCNWLFETYPAFVRIEAHVFPHNPASARVLENTGFEREGYARQKRCKQGQYIDCIVFAKIHRGFE